MQQSIADFLSGLSKSISQGFTEHGGIGNSIEEGIKKSRKKKYLLPGLRSQSLPPDFSCYSGGIASAIDAMFVMRGLGFVLVGLLGVLTGALVYKK